MSVRFAIIAAAAAVLAASAPASAHHGTAMYDFGGDVAVSGRVTAYSYAGPHIWLRLEAPGANGRMAEWSLEGPPPQYAGRRGWARDSLKPGQRISVTLAPHKGEANAGLILTVAEPGGRVLLERGRRY
jgi:hypothetical protein